MQVSELINDVTAACARITKGDPWLTPEQARQELIQNVYPALVEALKAVDDVYQRVEDEFVEDDEESFVDDELAAQIISTILIGEKMAEELEALATDDVTKKRVTELCTGWRKSAEITAEAIKEASAEDADDEDDEQEDEAG